jgi:TrmH family RNA methyltransferase
VEALSLTANIVEVPERIFASMADTKNSQGVILVAERPPTENGSSIMSALASAKLPLVIFLNEINNPSNLGALLRTAEAAGAAGVIASRNSADVYSPKALRAAMGSAFRLAIWDLAEPNEVFRWARENGLVPTATDASAMIDHTDLNWRTRRLLIFGSEAHGLDNLDRQEIQEMIRIPMEPQVESLNLAVSAGVILFEARRQIERPSE